VYIHGCKRGYVTAYRRRPETPTNKTQKRPAFDKTTLWKASHPNFLRNLTKLISLGLFVISGDSRNISMGRKNSKITPKVYFNAKAIYLLDLTFSTYARSQVFIIIICISAAYDLPLFSRWLSSGMLCPYDGRSNFLRKVGQYSIKLHGAVSQKIRRIKNIKCCLHFISLTELQGLERFNELNLPQQMAYPTDTEFREL
jgi:hypothetical protein